MKNSHISNEQELPSTGKLIKSTVIAFITAAVLLVTVVMPAEYGTDPTGVGQMLGADDTKTTHDVAMQTEAIVKEQANAPTMTHSHGTGEAHSHDNAHSHDTAHSHGTPHTHGAADTPTDTPEQNTPKTETVSLTLKPDQGAEIKAIMKKDATINYTWKSSGGKTNFDVHGDSKALNIRYHQYEKGSVKTKEGTLTAAFDGSHGWFWRNRTGKTLTITLEVTGDFIELKRVV